METEPPPDAQPNSPLNAPTTSPTSSGPDLDVIATDLADVEIALARLDAGTYFTDESTGEPLPESVLAEHPTARRSPAP